MRHRLQCRPENVASVTGNAVALENLRQSLDVSLQAMAFLAFGFHADERLDRIAELFAVDVDAVAANDPGRFQRLDALGRRGLRQADLSSELAEGLTGVPFEFGYEVPIRFVEIPARFQCHDGATTCEVK